MLLLTFLSHVHDCINKTQWLSKEFEESNKMPTIFPSWFYSY